MKKKAYCIFLIVCLFSGFLHSSASNTEHIEIVPCKTYHSVSEFHDGLAKVSIRTGDIWISGYIDKTGKEVIPLTYTMFTGTYSEGLAPVMKSVAWRQNEAGNEVENFIWRYIDTSGNEVFSLECEFANGFSEELASIANHGNPYYIDKTGARVLAPPYEVAGDFHEGLAVVAAQGENGQKWGFIDKTGNLVVPLKYQWAASFSEGLSLVEDTTGKIGYIDETGKEVIPCKYAGGFSFSDGLARVAIDTAAGRKCGYIDPMGNIAIPFIYDQADSFSEGLALVHIDGKSIYIDKNGREVLQGFDGELGTTIFNEGLLNVSKNGKWGYVDIRGNEAVAFQYDGATPVKNGFAIVQQNGFTGYIKIAGSEPSSWALAQVTAAIELNLVPRSLQLRYTQAITRAEFCELAVAFYENYTGEEITTRATFTDTADINVEKLASLQVVNGVGNNKFDPDSQLTREQAATMLTRLASAVYSPLPNNAATFVDNNAISKWAKDSVGQVQAAGIMEGIGNNTFAPKNPYTREQSILTMLRLWNH